MFDVSMRIYEIRLGQFEADADDDDSVRSTFILYQLLGGIYIECQKFDEAIDCLWVGLSLYLKRFASDEKVVADLYVELARLLHVRAGRDDCEQAISCLRSALRIFKLVLGSPTIEEATTLYNMAVVWKKAQNNVAASKSLQQASDVYRMLDIWSPNIDVLQVLIWLNLSTGRLVNIEGEGLDEMAIGTLTDRIQKLLQVLNE